MKKYVVLDLETGGLYPDNYAICSVGMVALDENFEPIDEYYTVAFEPMKKFSQEALNINGLTTEQIKNGTPIADVISKIEEWLDGSTIVCHNASFDVAFLNYRGFEITDAIDTLVIYRFLYPGESAKLIDACKRFSIDNNNAHNALADCHMTAKLLKEFSKMDGGMSILCQPKKIIFKK